MGLFIKDVTVSYMEESIISVSIVIAESKRKLLDFMIWEKSNFNYSENFWKKDFFFNRAALSENVKIHEQKLILIAFD